MEKLHTVVEVAEEYGVTKHVVNGWIHDKSLNIYRRVGRRIYLRFSDVELFLERETFYREQKQKKKTWR